MTDPRNPLITGVTNDAGYRGDDKLPTSYAVNQLFAGANIPANTSADTLMACGNYRFNTTTTSLPTHMLTKTGILTVMHDRPALPTNNNYGGNPSSSGGSASVIRQVAWPDDKDDVTPYTRTYQNGSWGEWQTMGGGLRRVKLESNLGNTANNEAKSLPNVMYYSFGNYTLTLPKTANLPYGSKIGLEQWGGEGAVVSSEQWTVQLTAGNINKYVNGRYPKSATENGQYTEATIVAEDVGSYIKESFMQVTSPAYESDLDGALTDIYIGPQVYQFEIVDNDGTKTWMMDVDNNIANTIAGIRRDIQTIGAASDRADRDFRELIGNDFAMPYYAWKNGNTILYTSHYAPTAGVAKAYSSKTVLSDQTVFGTVSALVRDSRQLITGIVVNGTTYIRSAEDDNTSNTISNKFAKETVDRAAADTELSNRLGSGITTSSTGTATAQITAINNKIGSANVYGEGAAISNSDGKTITELISNKGPRTLIYVVSSAIGANSEFKDANNDTYKFPALLNRINPTIVVNSPVGFLITLPAASNYKTVASGTNATVIHGAKCTIEVPVGHKVTVTDESQTEEFDNTGGSSTLVLPFEATTNASGTLIWQLLVVG